VPEVVEAATVGHCLGADTARPTENRAPERDNTAVVRKDGCAPDAQKFFLADQQLRYARDARARARARGVEEDRTVRSTRRSCSTSDNRELPLKSSTHWRL
jgi:hypothetical protein